MPQQKQRGSEVKYLLHNDKEPTLGPTFPTLS